MNNNHRVQNFYGKVTFDDLLSSRNHNIAADNSDYDEEGDHEDELEFLDGEDFDDTEEAEETKGFDTGTSKYDDESFNSPKEVKKDSAAKESKSKVQISFAGATMEVFYNPIYFNIPEKELFDLLVKLANSKRCIDCTAELEFGIINVRFNPTIQNDKDLDYVGRKIAEFIESKRRG